MKSNCYILSLGVLLLATNTIVFAATVPDPTGDTFGSGPVQVDIKAVDASFGSSNVNFTITFVGVIAPPSAGLPNSLSALVDLDTDQRPDMGIYPLTQMFSPPPALLMGAEVVVDVASEESHPGRVDILDAAGGTVLGTALITFRTNSISFAVPLSFLGTSGGRVNYSVVVGSPDEATDRVPNDSTPLKPAPPIEAAMNSQGKVVITVAQSSTDLVLQSSPTVTGPWSTWQTVPASATLGSTASYTNSLAGPTGFFRLGPH